MKDCWGRSRSVYGIWEGHEGRCDDSISCGDCLGTVARGIRWQREGAPSAGGSKMRY